VEDGQLRLGFRYVKEVGEVAIASLEAGRAKAPFASLRDFYRKTNLSREVIENLILAGAMDCFSQPKRQLLWELGLLERNGHDNLMLEYPDYQVPLPGMTELEELSAEYKVQGLSARLHPMEVIRKNISRDGVMRSSEILSLFSGTKVRTAGYVVCRQAPVTAKGHVFLTLEDEEGLLNIVLQPGVYHKYRYLVRTEPLLVIEGVVQKREGTLNIVAKHVASLGQERERQQAMYPTPAPKARDFC
jgi:error-prone DNA polymerase